MLLYGWPCNARLTEVLSSISISQHENIVNVIWERVGADEGYAWRGRRHPPCSGSGSPPNLVKGVLRGPGFFRARVRRESRSVLESQDTVLSPRRVIPVLTLSQTGV